MQTKIWPNYYSAHNASFAREMRQSDEYFQGRRQHLADIAGIRTRASEVKSEIARIQSSVRPDVARIERLQKILGHLESTLSKCR